MIGESGEKGSGISVPAARHDDDDDDEEDMALNNLQWLICHKTQPNQILWEGVVAIEKGAFGSPSTMVANFTYLYVKRGFGIK